MPVASLVVMYRGPGKIAWMIAAAVIPPKNCEIESKIALTGVMTPQSARAQDTAGLNKPPEIRKKIQAFTVSEKPKDSAINCNEDVFGACAVSATLLLPPELAVVVAPVMDVFGKFATLAPA